MPAEQIASVLKTASSLKAAIDIVKVIKDSGVSLEQAEIRLKFAELTEALVDAKMSVADIKVDLIEKNEEISRLKVAREIESNVYYEAPFYFLDGGKSQADGPFCQRCYDDEKKLVRLIEGQTYGGSEWVCSVCKSRFLPDRYDEAPTVEALKACSKRVKEFDGLL